MTTDLVATDEFDKVENIILGTPFEVLKIKKYDESHYGKFTYNKDKLPYSLLICHLSFVNIEVNKIIKDLPKRIGKYSFDTYSKMQIPKKIVNSVLKLLKFTCNLFAAINYFCKSDRENISKYKRIVNELGRVFLLIDYYVYKNQKINLDLFITNFIYLINDTKLKDGDYIRLDYSLHGDLIKERENICIYHFLDELKNFCNLNEIGGSYEFIKRYNLNFSYYDVFINIVHFNEHILYNYEKINIVLFINRWIKNLNINEIIRNLISTQKTMRGFNWITFEKIKKAIDTKYKFSISLNPQIKIKLINDIEILIKNSLEGKRCSFGKIISIHWYNNKIKCLLTKLIDFRRIYKKWNYNGNLTNVPIYMTSTNMFYFSQLSLSNNKKDFLTLKDINNLSITKYLFDDSNQLPFYKFDINSLEVYGKFKLCLTGKLINLLFINFKLYFTNPENNPFYSTKTHIYPIKDHIITLFCTNNRNTEKTAIRFLPSEICFHILSFMRLSDFNIEGLNKLE